MNKANMAIKLSEQCGLSKLKALEAIQALFGRPGEDGIIASQLAVRGGGKVVIPGFGTFAVVTRQARKGSNPVDHTAIDIPEKRVVRFKAGKVLRERVDAASAV